MKKFKRESIVIVHYSLPPVIGGVEEVLRQHANLFYRHYHRVKIIGGEGGEFSKDYEIVINPLLSAKNKKILSAHKNSIENGKNEDIYKLSSRIYRFLKRQIRGYEVLIAHNVLSMPFNLPLTLSLLKLSNDIKIISWNHDSPYFYPNYPEYLEREPWNVLKRKYKNISYVAITSARKEQFLKLYGEGEIEVITNGVDPIIFFEFSGVTVKVIKEFRLFSSDLIVLQPFRMVRRKNIELSILVLNELKKMGIKAKFILTGKYDPHSFDSRKYHKELKALIKKLNLKNDFIILTDIKLKSGERIVPTRKVLKDFYQLSDLVFIPSKQEGFGLPLIEAGLLKLPIFCSDIEPFKEVGGGDVNYFSLNDSPRDIAEKIVVYLNSRESSRMYRRVYKNYIIDNIYAQKILPLLRRNI